MLICDNTALTSLERCLHLGSGLLVQHGTAERSKLADNMRCISMHHRQVGEATRQDKRSHLFQPAWLIGCGHAFPSCLVGSGSALLSCRSMHSLDSRQVRTRILDGWGSMAQRSAASWRHGSALAGWDLTCRTISADSQSINQSITPFQHYGWVCPRRLWIFVLQASLS